MPTETLFCQFGQHHWTREVARGRKPVTCPEHRLIHREVVEPPKPSKPEKPQAKAQYAVITRHRYACLDDGQEVKLANRNHFNVGDQGMAEYGEKDGIGKWFFILFEAAPDLTEAEQRHFARLEKARQPLIPSPLDADALTIGRIEPECESPVRRGPTLAQLLIHLERYGPEGILEAASHLSEDEHAQLATACRKANKTNGKMTNGKKTKK
jgi:hypothetical protein